MPRWGSPFLLPSPPLRGRGGSTRPNPPHPCPSPPKRGRGENQAPAAWAWMRGRVHVWLHATTGPLRSPPSSLQHAPSRATSTRSRLPRNRFIQQLPRPKQGRNLIVTQVV